MKAYSKMVGVNKSGDLTSSPLSSFSRKKGGATILFCFKGMIIKILAAFTSIARGLH